MILEIDGWKFEIDMTTTMEYSAAEAADHCTCAYCRNFYAAIDDNYPELRPFLAQFGLDIEAPEELMPYDAAPVMVYDGVYAVCGKILTEGKGGIRVGEAYVFPEIEAPINRPAISPCFSLSVDGLELPWVLEEPMEDVVSPANQPSFLKRMWDKLLRRQPKDESST